MNSIPNKIINEYVDIDIISDVEKFIKWFNSLVNHDNSEELKVIVSENNNLNSEDDSESVSMNVMKYSKKSKNIPKLDISRSEEDEKLSYLNNDTVNNSLQSKFYINF